jgi:UDP-glucuronate 4-epimerase
MTILVTGVAGFIGYHVCEALLKRGESIVGVDNVSDYYDVNLKRERLLRLARHEGFAHLEIDISDSKRMLELANHTPVIDRIVHLAAQAGVRHSLTNPHVYLQTNIVGHTVMLELARRLASLKHLVYASSSSVYGSNEKLPASIEDRVDSPTSLYGATKQSGELISASYAHLFGIPQTGLRFFSVYGPWGRPDMVMFLFTRAILAGEPIELFNSGDMRRDFTYIDDIVSGVLAALDRPPPVKGSKPPHRRYNLGHNRPEELMRLVELLETACERKATRIMRPMQLGDVRVNYADIEASQRDLDFAPRTPIDVGVPRFVEWYRSYYGA